MGKKRTWWIAETKRGEANAIYASSLDEAEVLAGAYPYEQGEEVTIHEADEAEVKLYKLRDLPF